MAEPARATPDAYDGDRQADAVVRDAEQPDVAEQPDDGESEEESEEGTRQARAPWHFKVIVVGSVVYLGWRAYQGVSWLAHHIH